MGPQFRFVQQKPASFQHYRYAEFESKFVQLPIQLFEEMQL